MSNASDKCLTGEGNPRILDISQHLDSLNISDISTVSASTPISKSKKHQSYKKQNIQFYTVTQDTVLRVITLEANMSGKETVHKKDLGLCSVGGYESQICCIQEMLNRTFCADTSVNSATSLFASPRGVLLYGPSGCGKTLIVQALLNEYPVKKVIISGTKIWSK